MGESECTARMSSSLMLTGFSYGVSLNDSIALYSACFYS